MSQRSRHLLLTLVLLASCDKGRGQPTGVGHMQSFAAGQVWTYHTRPGEEASRVIIYLVESYPKRGEVVHVQVGGLHLRNRHEPNGFTGVVGHMPYSADALRHSMTGLESSGQPVPPFRDGYDEWRTAFDKGQAGVWTAPVAEAIAGMESAMNP